ncbi:MAG: hypothetical protein OES46_17400 [Gammaproteobacteria bacterium]|nr:hypothetical protein [Gammaproteobacteria bacterium]
MAPHTGDKDQFIENPAKLSDKTWGETARTIEQSFYRRGGHRLQAERERLSDSPA